MKREAALIALVVFGGVALAGCGTTTPPSPVAVIPKLIVDFQDNETLLYLTSLNADVRYANLSIVLSSENLTSNLTFNATKSFALVGDTNTNLSFFTVNASADDGRTFFFYNATMHIAPRTPAVPGQPPVYQIYIRDTPDGPIQTDVIPYRHVLGEGPG